jgi:His-Xaa-Ser system radical SAM maturase HxsC
MRLWSVGTAHGLTETTLGRLTSHPIERGDGRQDYVAFGKASQLAQFEGDWSGYAAVLCMDPRGSLTPEPDRAIFAPPQMDYLNESDVVAMDRSGGVRVWYRRNSENNAILLTEQCNSLCLMCSQPPKNVDDSARVPLVLRLLELIDPRAEVLTLSGGEPTLLGDALVRVVQKAKDALPNTGLHMLTNGRRFEDAAFAQRLAAVDHRDLVLGIPLYSDLDWNHDYVVQARGAFDQTLAGFYNLADAGIRLELRVVVHRQTFERLPQLAEFIARNLPFIEHVALMGLEMFGFTPRNLDALWIDPTDYAEQLVEATRVLALSGMNVSIYNHQLCTIPRETWSFARKSISDWKNVYLPQCESCGAKEFCGGFFQSATKRHSAGIRALPELDAATRAGMRDLAGLFAV